MAGDDFTGIILIGGLAVAGYVYKDEILAFFKKDGGNGGCTKTCDTGTHLNEELCTCIPDDCTKTCTLPKVINEACQCVTPTCNKTCSGNTVLNPTTCQCDPVGGAGGNITFAAAGDWGSGDNTHWKTTVATMGKGHPNVVIIPGDLSYRGGVATWKPVTDAIRKLPEHPKIFGAMGNHDSGSYSSTFDKFSNSVTTVGNVSFMALDANSASSAVTYAKANFSKMTAKFKVVFFHQPAVCTSSKHGVDKTMAKLIPEFEKAKINLVVQAHNHIYLRYAPKGGVTYTVVGTGGEDHYTLGSNCPGCPAIMKSNVKDFGALICTSGTTLSCKFVANSGTVVDSFNA